MSKKLEIKDELYYSDLMYELKSLAGFDVDGSFELWQRITERKKEIIVDEMIGNVCIPTSIFSTFYEELFEIVGWISKKANVSFGSIEQISEYPLIVIDALMELRNRELENEMLIHLKNVVKDMGLENEFSLGEIREQSVCLNKSNKVWEVFLVERGIIFEKFMYEECIDACIEVIHQLSESKQIFEEKKEEFVKRKKMTLQKNTEN